MVRRAWVIAIAVLVPGVAAALPPIRSAPECRSFSAGSATVQVRWATPTRTPGCFYFSGPGDLGRDDHLGTTAEWGRNGDRVTLRFGSLVFQGSIRGRDVRLERVSEHSYGGPWRVTETIEGTLTSEGCEQLVARYHYDECDTSMPGSCPGDCHIDAAIVLEGR